MFIAYISMNIDIFRMSIKFIIPNIELTNWGINDTLMCDNRCSLMYRFGYIYRASEQHST